MPRNNSDSASAFHQVWKVQRESKIQAICIPSIAEIAPVYGRIAIHYVNVVVKELGGEAYLDRILTPEGSIEITQYCYNLVTHKITPVDMDLGDEDGDD
eukprot:2917560-Ditylum_brightwellii.AAC.1